MSTEKKIWLVMAVFIGLFAYGVWNLFSPDAFPISFVRGEVREVSPGVLAGPYPSKDELKLLSDKGVSEVVCLMDPRLAIEKPLVEEEKRMASELNIVFSNYPMDFSDMEGKDAEEELGKAVKYLVGKNGASRVYVHCYLGRHRVGLFVEAYKKAASLKSVSPSPLQSAPQPSSTERAPVRDSHARQAP
ncbi:MAG: hypothetical protein HYV24_07095 [Deltaproteobacteria bacterium]|nr:hypothetical protein [Deltaproteobacteria bacterium]